LVAAAKLCGGPSLSNLRTVWRNPNDYKSLMERAGVKSDHSE